MAMRCAYKGSMKKATSKIPVGLKFSPDTLSALDEWIAAQTVAPSKNAVVEKAVREFIGAKDPE